MKLEGKNIRFLPVRSFFGRNGLYFVGRGNTMQLLETALVIEGNQKTIGLFLVDILFRQALSEWTTVTIPYTRIARCKYSRHLLTTIGIFLAIFLPVFLLIAGLAFDSGERFGAKAALGVLLIAAALLVPVGLILLVLYVVFDIGPRTTLVYRRPDGRLIQVAFRIRPSALRKSFLTRVEANRQAACGSGGAPNTKRIRG